jgi:predicted flap endonuclease-1-like 5' DNA nuclease
VIWHLLELWLLLVAAYLLGSIIGVLAYIAIERSPLAATQGAIADAIGDWIDAVKTQYGVGPAWRPDVKRAAARSWRAARGGRAEDDELPLKSTAAIVTREDASRPDAAYTRDELDFRDHAVDDWSDGVADSSRYGDVDEPLDFAEPEMNGEVVATVDGADAAPLQPLLDLPAMRPAGLPAPRNGVADDLQRIRGIGRRNEQLLNSLGIYHFGQIAAWTPAEARWVAAFLAFPERIERDDWIGQATILASGGQTGYVKSRRKEAEDET